MTVRRIVAAVERLQQFPESGRIVPERQSRDLREIISGQFRIVYRQTGTSIEIVTVFRGARDFSTLGI